MWPFLYYIDLLKMKSPVWRYSKIVKVKAKIYGFFHYQMISNAKQPMSRRLRKI